MAKIKGPKKTNRYPDEFRYSFYNFSDLYINHLNYRVDPVENRSGIREKKD